MQTAEDVPLFSCAECSEPEAVGDFIKGGGKQPEAFLIFRGWAANSVRLSAIFTTRAEKSANSLRRPAVFGTGAQKKCKQLEVVVNFSKNVQKT